MIGLIDLAKRDVMKITSNAKTGFGVSVTFTAPTAETATINAMIMKHHTAIDELRNLVASRTAHVAFSEQLLVAAGYPVRNAKGMVSLKDHHVAYKDSTGVVGNYVIREWFPDETVGMIVGILGYLS